LSLFVSDEEKSYPDEVDELLFGVVGESVAEEF
jgi:hypothetical protein